ncbi:hypothetical protein OBBRIDRAFT_695497, partial [Obba rivulosa]
MDSDGLATTTLFLSNLHCSSCVHTIQETLSGLSPPPLEVDVSIVTQTVTVRHPPELSPIAIKVALDEAGFDIAATPTDEVIDGPPSSFSRSLSHLSTLLAGKLRKHVEQCAQ